MSFGHFNFKKEVIALTIIWIICTILIYKAFPTSPYQGQSVVIYYANLVTAAFYPALFLFFVYLSLWSIIEIIIEKFKKPRIPAVSSTDRTN